MSNKPNEEKSKEELSFEQKVAARRAAMTQKSRLTLSEEFKEKGYTYRICNVSPGNIENYKDKAYEVVTHPISSGSDNLARPEVNGNPHEFEVGGATGTQKAIWMRISDKEKALNDFINKQDADTLQSTLYQGKDKDGNPFIPDGHQYGKITKDF